jgi:hypothetical protein
VPHIEDRQIRASEELGLEQGVSHLIALHNFYIEDLDILIGLLLVDTCVLDFVDYVKSLDCSSKYGMLVVKPRLLRILAMVFIIDRWCENLPSFP